MKEKIKARLKSYGFWVSMASAVMVFLNTLGLKVDIPYLSQVTTAFLSILVIAGIISKPGEPPAATGAEEAEEGAAEEDAAEEDVNAEKQADAGVAAAQNAEHEAETAAAEYPQLAGKETPPV